MNPERKKQINGYEILEYYWHGDYPVYIDNYLTKETFEEACERLANKAIHADGENRCTCGEDDWAYTELCENCREGRS